MIYCGIPPESRKEYEARMKKQRLRSKQTLTYDASEYKINVNVDNINPYLYIGGSSERHRYENTWSSIKEDSSTQKIYVFREDIKNRNGEILFLKDKEYHFLFYSMGSDWIRSEFGVNYPIYDLKNYYSAKIKKIIYR